MKILVLNAGSSSQKSCLYELGDSLPGAPPPPLWQAQIDWGSSSGAGTLRVKTCRGARHEEQLPVESRAMAITHLVGALSSGPYKVISQASEIGVVGHRVVHGGQQYVEPARVTPQVKAAIARLAEFAPLHNLADLEGMEIVERLLGSIPQVAVFDTAFHSQLSLPAAVYPGPYEWLDFGIRRYGFHGISHEYCAHRAAEILGHDLESLRLITCHLGNGCSLAAIHQGRSVDTTMGFTPLEGLMMGTRSGSLDPGILIYLLRERGYTAEKLDQVLNHESGLHGVSGVSGDMREVLAAMAEGNARAKLAFDIYIHRLRSAMGSMLGALGGLDAVAFTGGVGENSAQVRAAACEPFAFLGLKLDAGKNASSPPDQDISDVASTVRAVIVHAEEDWAIARECWRLVAAQSS